MEPSSNTTRDHAFRGSRELPLRSSKWLSSRQNYDLFVTTLIRLGYDVPE